MTALAGITDFTPPFAPPFKPLKPFKPFKAPPLEGCFGSTPQMSARGVAFDATAKGCPFFCDPIYMFSFRLINLDEYIFIF